MRFHTKTHYCVQEKTNENVNVGESILLRFRILLLKTDYRGRGLSAISKVKEGQRKGE